MAIDLSKPTSEQRYEFIKFLTSEIKQYDKLCVLFLSVIKGEGYFHCCHNVHSVYATYLHSDGYTLVDFDTFANEYIRPKVDKSKPKVIGYELPGDYGPLRKGAKSTEITESNVVFKDEIGYIVPIPLWNAQKAFIPIYEEVEPTAWDIHSNYMNENPFSMPNDTAYIEWFNATFELKGNDKERKNTATAKG